MDPSTTPIFILESHFKLLQIFFWHSIDLYFRMQNLCCIYFTADIEGLASVFNGIVTNCPPNTSWCWFQEMTLNSCIESTKNRKGRKYIKGLSHQTLDVTLGSTQLNLNLWQKATSSVDNGHMNQAIWRKFDSCGHSIWFCATVVHCGISWIQNNFVYSV
jgi:hypothetical protein